MAKLVGELKKGTHDRRQDRAIGSEAGRGLTAQDMLVLPNMLVLLNMLAHNVLVWARDWLAEDAPRLSRYGSLRIVCDLMSISGLIELDQRNKVKRIILNRAASLARGLLSALRRLLLQEDVVIILDKI